MNEINKKYTKTRRILGSRAPHWVRKGQTVPFFGLIGAYIDSRGRAHTRARARAGTHAGAGAGAGGHTRGRACVQVSARECVRITQGCVKRFARAVGCMCVLDAHEA